MLANRWGGGATFQSMCHFVRLNVEGRFLFRSAVGQPSWQEMVICANPREHRVLGEETSKVGYPGQYEKSKHCWLFSIMSYGLNTAGQNSILQGWTEFCRSAVILHIALNIRMVSAPLSNMFTRLIELTIPGTFLYYDLNQMFGIVKNVTKRPVFHQIFDSGPLLSTSAWYLHPSQTRWDCSSSWQFMVCFCTTTWIKC